MLPLDELQVIDLTTGIAGPYCTKLLRDAGADVIKVEPPAGDPLRRYAATTDVSEREDAALFRFLNAGKRSVLGSVGQQPVDDLLAGADLLVEDQAAAVDVTQMRLRYPHLVILSITPYGRTGPYAGRPASDLTIQCESGAILFRGPADRPPVQAGGRISEFMAGAFAAPLAVAAMLRARAGGPGAHLDLSMHEVMAIAGSNYMDVLHQFQGSPAPGPGLRMVDTPGIERAKDGLVGFNTNTAQMFQMFLLLIGHPELMDDPRYAALNTRAAMGQEWQRLIDEGIGTRTVAEVVEEAAALRIAVAPVHDGSTVAQDDQLVARGVFQRGDTDPLLRPLPPYRIDGEAPPLGPRAPHVGEHTGSVTPRPARPAPTEREPRLPLSGARVIDLTSWWVGALATQTLAMLGADVIHVEGLAHLDGMRLTSRVIARTDDWWEWGHMFTAANAQKRGVTLDLSRDEGRAVLRELIASADVLVENFAPRVVERWSLAREDVQALNPNLVYVRMPAFGLTGPWRDRPAFAQVIEPMSTMASITGFPDGLPVSKGGLPDPVAGVHGAFAAMIGIAKQRKQGSGVFVESVMIDAAVNVTAQPLLEYDAYGRVMDRLGNRSPHAAPQGVYPTAGGGWFGLSVTTDAEWQALVDALGRPDWATDGALSTATGRHGQHDRIDQEICRWAQQHSAREASERLVAHGVPAAPCRDPRGIREHPHLKARGLYERLEHPVVGEHLIPGMPCRFEGVSRWLHTPAPTVGQHNSEILQEILGATVDQIGALERDGIIGTRPVGI
jgi:crotonobetainyl-CoA:carnitine CoA-transferase CaiB-like acyl-CoA transferase